MFLPRNTTPLVVCGDQLATRSIVSVPRRCFLALYASGIGLVLTTWGLTLCVLRANLTGSTSARSFTRPEGNGTRKSGERCTGWQRKSTDDEMARQRQETRKHGREECYIFVFLLLFMSGRFRHLYRILFSKDLLYCAGCKRVAIDGMCVKFCHHMDKSTQTRYRDATRTDVGGMSIESSFTEGFAIAGETCTNIKISQGHLIS